MIVTQPNQKIIIGVHKYNSKKHFSIIPDEEEEMAVSNLSHSGLRVWLWLMRLPDSPSIKFALSPAIIANKFHMSVPSIQRGINELMEHKYLVSAGGNGYHFYSRPYDEESYAAKKHQANKELAELDALMGGMDIDELSPETMPEISTPNPPIKRRAMSEREAEAMEGFYLK